MENVLGKIEADKEILQSMPKNNKKNISFYIEKIEELKQEYIQEKNEIYEKLEKEYKRITSIEQNEKIQELKTRINKLEEIIELITPLDTSYEKTGIDKIVYKLGKFYKENLDIINLEINECIQKFSELGIILKPEDFDYSIYVNEYMKTFFIEMKKENINSETIKKLFEQIYWKCPDIIIHIELNLRYIYMKNKKQIDKYYLEKEKDLSKKYKINLNSIVKKNNELRQELEKEIQKDKSILIDKFLTGELNPKDYEEEKIKEEFLKILPEEIINIEKNEIEINCIKFLNSLNEYKDYLKFQYIFDDIKNKYKQCNEHKNTYNEIRRNIDKKEKKLKKINKKLFRKKSLFRKKENNLAEYNSIFLEIKSLYKKLDSEEIYIQIAKNISDNSTIYDCLNFASKYYRYLVECIISKNKEIMPNEIDELIEQLKEFVKNPNNILIKNITIFEEKNIPIIISDRYKLLNFKVTKEDISENNIDGLINTLQKIKNFIYVKESKTNLEDMEFICEFTKILNSK